MKAAYSGQAMKALLAQQRALQADVDWMTTSAESIDTGDSDRLGGPKVAQATGGRSIVAASNAAFREVVADSGSYYWLGFTPAWKADGARSFERADSVGRSGGRWRKIGGMDIAILLSTLGLLRGGLETKAACLGERLARRGHRVTLVAPLWLSAGRLAPDLKELPVEWVRVLCPSVEGLRRRLGRPCSIERLGTGFYRGCLAHPGVRALMARAEATFTLLTTDTAYFSEWRRRLGRGHVSYTSGGGRKWLARDVSTVRLVNPLAAHTSPSIAGFAMDFELPPGIPDELLEIRYEVRPRGTRLLYVGRLESNKGVSELLDLFCDLSRQIPDLTLRLVGDGPLRRGLRQKAAEAGLTARVSFAGEVGLHRVWEEMRAADLLIHPSSCESFPFTLLEAQAAGLPFVSTDIPGIRGAVPASSRLLPFGAWDLWREAVRDLVEDREERLRLSEVGRAWARDYTWDGPVEVLARSLRLAAERCGRKVEA